MNNDKMREAFEAEYGSGWDDPMCANMKHNFCKGYLSATQQADERYKPLVEALEKITQCCSHRVAIRLALHALTDIEQQMNNGQ